MDSELINEALLPEAHRMQQLIEQLLLLARSDEDALNLRQDDVDLDDLLSAEVSRLRAVGSLHIVSHIQACRAVGDRAALAQVIRNLVDNAARHALSAVELIAVMTPGSPSSRSPMTGPESRCRSGLASSNGSSASTTRAPGPREDLV